MQNLPLTELTPMLWTEDIPATIHFYETILGFKCVERNDDWGWAALERGNIGIMLAKPNEHTKYDKIGFTGTFYFRTTDVNAWWEQLKDHPNISYPIENFEFGMREFAILDNNGYMIQIGQEIPPK